MKALMICILASLLIAGCAPDEPEDVGSVAEEFTCTYKLNDEVNSLSYLARDAMLSNAADENTCPPLVLLRHLTPDLTDLQRSVFCMQYDKEKTSYIGTGFGIGERDPDLNCRARNRTYCEVVNDAQAKARAEAVALLSFGGGASTGASAVKAAGITAVKHSSGAYILTGPAGYISGTLGTLGAKALAFLNSPITVGVVVSAVVVVGVSVYLCKDETTIVG